jgi:uncharacterized protein
MTQAFFVQANPGYRFCLFHRSSGAARGAVLFLHAFAEEMNKSRRMAALQATALSRAGFDVLQIDLLGCGDSSGDFSEATWEAWLEDVRIGLQALGRHSDAPVWLWGHRSGCLLACEFAHRASQPSRLVLWHPIIEGRSYLNQFLRMRLLVQTGDDGVPSDARSLRAALAAGQSIEVAGYALSPTLFEGLDQAVLRAPPPGSRVCWLDAAHDADAPVSPSSLQYVDGWLQEGVLVSHANVVCPPFWQTQEITQCESLITRTLESMCR